MGNRRDGANWRLIGLIFLVVVGGYIALQLLGAVLGLVWGIVKFALPVLVIGGVVYAVVRAKNGRGLLGGGRRTLP